jgi:hypothetical protein
MPTVGNAATAALLASADTSVSAGDVNLDDFTLTMGTGISANPLVFSRPVEMAIVPDSSTMPLLNPAPLPPVGLF